MTGLQGGARCSADRGTFHRWPDSTVLVGCGCGWTMDGLPSARRAKRELHRHRIMARGERYLRGYHHTRPLPAPEQPVTGLPWWRPGEQPRTAAEHDHAPGSECPACGGWCSPDCICRQQATP